MKIHMLNFVAAAVTMCSSGAYAKGTLDKAEIRTVMRNHIGEVKACYESELATKKDLAGRVMIRFTISAAGTVTDSAVEQTTLGSPTVENCIAKAVRGWAFPKPKGNDSVVVSYPFVLAAE